MTMPLDIIFWRHAEAEAGEPDLERKLTAKGEKQARRIAEWLEARLPETARVYSSPARRAQQTAQQLAKVSNRKIRTLDALQPNAEAREIVSALEDIGGKSTIVVVGHQPGLGEAIALMLGGHEWTLKKGGLVWLSRREGNGDEPTVRAAISPDLL